MPCVSLMAAFGIPGDTIVVIDEIQDSVKVYSLIRQFAREFSCDFVITGSYLGKTLSREYFQPVGDLDIMTLDTLTFEEFLDAEGKRDLYNSVDLYGKSSHEEYDELKRYYDLYCQIGGLSGGCENLSGNEKYGNLPGRAGSGDPYFYRGITGIF